MPALLKNYIDLGYGDGASAYTDFLNARTQLYYAGDYIEDEEWALAKTALYNAADLFGTCASYLLSDDIWGEGLRGHWKDALYWINDNWPGDGDGVVTMDAILSCMITATFSQLQTFVGLVDAYRVALWNEPFNSEYYAALARGFMP